MKRILISMGVSLILVTGSVLGYNTLQKEQNLAENMLKANIEALSVMTESGGGHCSTECGGGDCVWVVVGNSQVLTYYCR